MDSYNGQSIDQVAAILREKADILDYGLEYYYGYDPKYGCKQWHWSSVAQMTHTVWDRVTIQGGFNPGGEPVDL